MPPCDSCRHDAALSRRPDPLGLVGAGGIGFYIQLYVRSFQYDKVATLILVVLAMVLAIEQLNTLLRSLLR